MTMVDDAMLSS